MITRYLLLLRFILSTGLLVLLFADSAMAESPLEVGVAIKVNQITSINQSQENFSVVANLRMEWFEPKLIATADEQITSQPIYRAEDFGRMATEQGLIWPAHYFENVQGRIAYQNRLVAIDPDGKVTYIASFTATFQAPDFDFRKFPLDKQNFFLTLDSLRPLEDIRFKPMKQFSGLGDSLGEEEWILENPQFKSSTYDAFDFDASRLTLSFQGERHILYYIVRILIPVSIIVLVSWFTFFLKDYDKRIDLASGNLLLFIAFNFTIANDLPRLGYMTLMDTFMMATFVITGLVVLANVWLKQLQSRNKGRFIDVIDTIGLWLYPLFYAGGGLAVFLIYKQL